MKYYQNKNEVKSKKFSIIDFYLVVSTLSYMIFSLFLAYLKTIQKINNFEKEKYITYTFDQKKLISNVTL